MHSAEGATQLDFSADTHWHHYGVWKAQFPSEILSNTQSRPFLEQHVRDCVEARANARFNDDSEVAWLGAVMGENGIRSVENRCRRSLFCSFLLLKLRFYPAD